MIVLRAMISALALDARQNTHLQQLTIKSFKKGGSKMPKATFYRLELTKKRQLFRALKKEFEYKSFADASINEIIKTAGIARGSFYQYFEDKLDCYLYFVEKLQKKT